MGTLLCIDKDSNEWRHMQQRHAQHRYGVVQHQAGCRQIPILCSRRNWPRSKPSFFLSFAARSSFTVVVVGEQVLMTLMFQR
ncbi:uncharacterized protein K452DRAFT_156063 [Aplosporella prunicola CBS 121167]|uniref:Uncharacterized protein n=1 Tax=Aplosporella prunicola CBS 121167 TaxID=1176127 RepID=A0A6A6BKV1_9PEZI|nr:uncharacterized protein K452DRAFT_156063 [Aplosporella prunicola CBS 121167]KAF2144288.1 hypothetical protein K452DRAFT_156063 [Aplosporella prunicola CBS 121167]